MIFGRGPGDVCLKEIISTPGMTVLGPGRLLILDTGNNRSGA
jgi:hypothetical protein